MPPKDREPANTSTLSVLYEFGPSLVASHAVSPHTCSATSPDRKSEAPLVTAVTVKGASSGATKDHSRTLAGRSPSRTGSALRYSGSTSRSGVSGCGARGAGEGEGVGLGSVLAPAGATSTRREKGASPAPCEATRM